MRLLLRQPHSFIALLVAMLFGLLYSVAFAQSFNQQINYQGKLTDNTGATVADGTYNIAFNIYTAPASGSPIWSSTTTVAVTNGLFSYMLGSDDTLSGVDFDQILYLAVNVGGTGAPTWDGEMTPRKVFGTVPSAFEALNARTLDDIATSSFLRSDISDQADAFLTFTAGASTSDLVVSGTATTSRLVINGDNFSDLTGAGLTVTGGALTANISEAQLNIAAAPVNGYVLQASSTAAGGFVWQATSSLGINGTADDLSNNSITDLSDVDTSGALSGNILAFNGSSWVDVSTSTFLLESELSTEAALEALLGDVTDVFTNNDIIASTSLAAEVLVAAELSTSAELAALLSDETGSAGGGLAVFSNNPLFTGLRSNASSTISLLTFDTATGTTLVLGGDTITDINGAGLTLTAGVLSADLGTAIDESELNIAGGPTDGYVLQASSTSVGGFAWVATSTLGISGSSLWTQDGSDIYYNTGNVGIGSSTPTNLLSIDGVGTSADEDGISFGVDGENWGSILFYDSDQSATQNFRLSFGGATEDLKFQSDTNDNILYLADNGRVAVGTSSPQSELDVWGDFRVGTSTTPALIVRADNGRIGIGTANPGRLIDIVNTAPVIALTDSDTGSLVRLSADSANGSFQFEIDDTNAISGSDMNIQIDGTTYFTFEEGGDFGIGDTTPDQKLDVEGANAQIMVTETATDFLRLGIGETPSTTVLGYADTNALLFGVYAAGSDTSLNEYARFTSGGNFGLGTTSPASKLTVYGDAFLEGSNRYLNFGTATGTTGYGLRDNAGTLEFKNSGGSWTAFGASSSLFTDDGDFTYLTAVTDDLYIGTSTQTIGNAKLTIQSEGTSDILNLFETSGQEVFTVLESGNVGIGTTTPTTILGIDNRSLTGSVTGGYSQFIGLENSTLDAVQYGNRTYIRATSTATSTIVGSIIRIEDTTGLGNTVRGFEVQANKGGTTKGENTALSGFARTFGVRGYTSGDAGALYEPAGGFFETAGTSQGNAIRGYSASITTGQLLSLFQESSVFEGTGLLMDFGNGGGTFASTTSKFVDLQNAGESKFIVYQDGTATIVGTTTIGASTTATMASLQIGFGGLCVDNDGACVASTTGKITAVSYGTANSDLAELYFSSETLQPGELVVSDGFISVERADGTNGEVLGVISTKPGLTMGSDDTPLLPNQRGYPLALTGRVPVRLSTENGPIKNGDPLTISSIPGVAMKAIEAGNIIGYALEDFDGTNAYTPGFVNQFGDDIAQPNLSVANELKARKRKADCYYGGGAATGEVTETCDPNDIPEEAESLLGPGPTEQEIAQAEYEAEMQALDDLIREPAETHSIGEKTVQVGQVIMFVERGYYQLASQTNILNELASTSPDLVLGQVSDDETLWSRLKVLAQNFVDGVLAVAGLKADKVETSELCVDDVCVTANDLRALLEAANTDGQFVEVVVVDAETETGSGSDSADAPTPPGNEVSPDTSSTASEYATSSELVEESGAEAPTAEASTTPATTTEADSAPQPTEPEIEPELVAEEVADTAVSAEPEPESTPTPETEGEPTLAPEPEPTPETEPAPVPEIE